MRARAPGVAVAGVTALVSGVSVFVNSYGVRAGASPAVYTTEKNAVAFALLAALSLGGALARRRGRHGPAARFASVAPSPGPSPLRGRRALGPRIALAYVAVVGGGLAFVLFFDGLAQSAPGPAAFWRASLVVWVAVLGVAALGERLRWWNALALALVVVGEVVASGGAGGLTLARGQLEVLASSALWALEIVIARRLLATRAPSTVALVRMGGGAATLVAYLALTGGLSGLASITADQLHWALWTGALLALYVATWMTALARSRALDVTCVLAAAAPVTWLLQVGAGAATTGLADAGLVLVAAGALLVARGATRAQARAGTAVGP